MTNASYTNLPALFDSVGQFLIDLRELQESWSKLSPEQRAALAIEAFPPVTAPADAAPGVGLLSWPRARDAAGLAHLRRLMANGIPVAALPLLPSPPTGLPALEALGRALLERLERPPAEKARSPRRGKKS